VDRESDRQEHAGAAPLALLVAAVLAGVLLDGCRRTDAAMAKAVPAAPVTVASAQARDMAVELQAVGHVEA